MTPIISRKEARLNGAKRFFTGIPCGNGHISERYTTNNICVQCMNMHNHTAVNKEKRRLAVARWRTENKETAREKDRDWYQRNRDKKRGKRKEYYWTNRDLELAKQKKWRKENPEKFAKIKAAWTAANPERAALNYKVNGARRQARLRCATGSHTINDIRRILKEQNGRCAYCRTKLGKRYHVDHIQPLSRGGTNDPSNLQALCPSCNHSKHARDPIDFAQSRGLLL